MYISLSLYIYIYIYTHTTYTYIYIYIYIYLPTPLCELPDLGGYGYRTGVWCRNIELIL